MIESTVQTDLFGNELVGTPRVDRAQLSQTLALILRDMTLDELVLMITNRYREALDYQLLSRGESMVRGNDPVCQRMSLLFNPHRLTTKTATSKQSIYDAMLTHDSFHDGLARATAMKYGKHTFAELFYFTIQLGINGIQYVNEFPPHAMRDMCLRYGLSSTSHVLDPCAGWGGRMIGASVVAKSYTCYDPSTLTAKGLVELAKFIATMRTGFDTSVNCEPYEDSDERADHYDFALTSPPYYDSEHYSTEATNSLNRYATFDDWCAGFYLPLIDKTMRQLKIGAPFVLNIGDRRYPLTERMQQHCAGEGYVVRQIKGPLVNSAGLGRDGDLGEKFFEIRRNA